MQSRLLGLCLGLALVASPSSGRQPPDPLSILASMSGAYAGVRDFTMRLHKEERIKTLSRGQPSFKMESQDAVVRVRKRGDPAHGRYERDIYFDADCWLCPAAVYRDGVNDNTISVPLMSLKLRSPRAMNNQHHPITNLDLGETIALVNDNVSRARKDGHALVEYQGLASVDGRSAHQIAVTIPWQTRSVPVSPGDTLWSIADRTGQDMYVIFYSNPSVARPDVALTGTQVVVPEFYARRLTIWVDTAQALPLKLEVFDADDVLYERYVYADLKINVGLTDADFR